MPGYPWGKYGHQQFRNELVSPDHVDSALVNEKWHYNLFIQERPKTESNAYKLYYSIELGIIKIDFSDESTWELEKLD